MGSVPRVGKKYRERSGTKNRPSSFLSAFSQTWRVSCVEFYFGWWESPFRSSFSHLSLTSSSFSRLCVSRPCIPVHSQGFFSPSSSPEIRQNYWDSSATEVVKFAIILEGAEVSVLLSVRLRVIEPAVTARVTSPSPMMRKNPISRTKGLHGLDMCSYPANFAAPEIQLKGNSQAGSGLPESGLGSIRAKRHRFWNSRKR